MIPVFICDAVRTPIGRYGGALATVRADDLAAIPLRALLERNPQLDPAALQEVALGCANQSGEDNRNVARMALLLAGLPVSVPGVTVNRLCASGLEAITTIARSIACGEIELGIAGGVESMSRAPYVLGKSGEASSRAAKLEDTTMGWRFVNPAMAASHGVDPMPRTAENVAEFYRISREDQDAFALRSQARAAAARSAGFHRGEIVPVRLAAQRRGQEAVVVIEDEHPRADTTLERLSRLEPLFGLGSTVTAGNSSGINDGAAAMILATEKSAHRFGLRPRARFLGAASAGVEPRLMGIGPVPSTQALLARLSLSIDDFDAIELNEAFASQSLAVLRLLGLADDAPQLNPNGGAIALGHPLGMSGVRLVMTLIHQLEAMSGRRGLATMCVGVGQGMSVAVERA